MARDRAMEQWLQNQVGPAYDALEADPARAITVDQLRARLAREHKAATVKAAWCRIKSYSRLRR